MRHNFPKIMDHVFDIEGGFVDHPEDPGGATNMGITIHTMRALEMDLDKDGDIDRDDVLLVTRPIAEEIYKDLYWDEVEADTMPNGVDAVLVDGAINSGPRASVRWLQRALKVTPDGRLGPQTRGAVEASQDLSGLVKATLNERRKSVRQFRKYHVFGRGWENRMNAVEQLALGLIK